MKPLVEQARREFSERIPFVLYDLDTQGGRAMANKYKVTGIPTLIYIRKTGSIANKIDGSTGLSTIERNTASLGR